MTNALNSTMNTTVAPKQSFNAIAQVVFPDRINSLPVVLPMIASLTHQTSDRWVTWITHRQPSKDMLEAYGANLTRLRIVHVNQGDDIRWIAWQALAQCNSHTVIAEQQEWFQEDIAALESAAIKTGSKGVMIALKES